MHSYIAHMDKAEGRYGVVFPDLPGCTAMGNTADEAAKSAAVALSEWMDDWTADGNSPPAATSVAEIVASGDFGGLSTGSGCVIEIEY